MKRSNLIFQALLTLLILIMLSCCKENNVKFADYTYAKIPAFPEAKGFGAFTPGGRGGKLYFVTTTDDYIPGKENPIEGSLRHAIEAKGKRIILFRVSGLIRLKAPLVISNPYVTIAGQSAPGDGICVADYTFYIATHDVIIRYMRFRLGDLIQKEFSTLFIQDGSNLIFDHCSISWSIDENITMIPDGNNITIQWCIISEALKRSFHPKGKHSHGTLLYSKQGGLSLYYNILAHNDTRNPRPGGPQGYPGPILDFRNNIIYNWYSTAGYSGKYGQRSRINYVSNYLKPGPSTSPGMAKSIFNPNDRMTELFFERNFLDGYPEYTKDNWLMITGSRELKKAVRVDQPFPAPRIQNISAQGIYSKLLANTGAIKPSRDNADQRVVNDIIKGTGTIIDSQYDVGGWPVYNSTQPPVDSDLDGMPDAWEEKYGLNPERSTDNNEDADKDGYTNIEEYLNDTDPLVQEIIQMNYHEFKELMKQVDELNRLKMEEIENEYEKTTTELPDINPQLDSIQNRSLHEVSLTIDNENEMKFRLIPAGTFIMGSPENELEREPNETQHKVTISQPFYMGTTPVTIGQYKAVLGDIPRNEGNKNVPVRVSWPDAVRFCERLTKLTNQKFRLPTEAEWEYSCRAGTTTPFNTGMTISTDQANYDGKYVYGNGEPGTYYGDLTPVDMFPPNSWGLYDMHGNFLEWCLDYFGPYPTEHVTDPVGPGHGDGRVLRGGSFSSHPEYIRSAARYRYVTRVEFAFRIVMELNKK